MEIDNREQQSAVPVLCSWGANSYGQLSHGDTVDKLMPCLVTNKDIPMDLPSPVYITGGGGHALALTYSGGLLECGSNKKGQLGLGHRDDMHTLKLLESLKDEVITHVCGGWDFSLAVTDTGKLYAWGSNGHGQLGLPDIPADRDTPEEVKIGVKIIQVAAGLWHSVILGKDGQVFTCGNGKRGQLGITDNGNAVQSLRTFSEVLFINKRGCVNCIAAGSNHSACITNHGEVFVWGCNKYGQSSQDPKETVKVETPYQLNKDFFGHAPLKIISGWTHLCVLTGANEVITWGRCDYGQLGRVNITGSFCQTPSKVNFNKGVAIQTVSCSSENTAALTDSGVLYSWGWNEHGICGTGDEDNKLVPVTTTVQEQFTPRFVGHGAGCTYLLP